MTPADPPVIDAVFVDLPADPPKPPPPDQRPPEGYGRRTVAGKGRRIAEVITGVLEDAAPVARLLGAEDAADMAEKGAAVVREAPRFVEAVDRESRPLRGKLRELYEAAEKKGWVSTRPPKPAAKAPRRPVGPQRKARKEDSRG